MEICAGHEQICIHRIPVSILVFPLSRLASSDKLCLSCKNCRFADGISDHGTSAQDITKKRLKDHKNRSGPLLKVGNDEVQPAQWMLRREMDKLRCPKKPRVLSRKYAEMSPVISTTHDLGFGKGDHD
jgi:hypothetical protein